MATPSTSSPSTSTASPVWQRPWVRWAGPLLLLVVLAVMPLVLSEFANQTIARIGVYAVAVLGLNVVMGYTGQVSLGQIFFLGFGAYVTAYGVSNDWNIVLVFASHGQLGRRAAGSGFRPGDAADPAPIRG